MSSATAIALVRALCVLACALGGCTSADGFELPEDAVRVPQVDRQSQYRLDPGHQGLSASDGVLDGPLGVVWMTPALGVGTYTASKSSPAVDRDQLFVGQDDGVLYALDRDTGDVRWRFATHQHHAQADLRGDARLGIHGSPAFDDERVYIGDYAGFLYALDKATGDLRWERSLGGSIGSSPVLYAGLVLVGVEFPEPNGKVFALDAESGEVLLRSEFLGAHVHATVSLAPEFGRLLVGTNAGDFFGLDFAGRVVFRRRVGGAIKSTAAVAGDIAYVSAWDGRLHAFDTSSGMPRFSVASEARSMSSPSVANGRVYFGSDDGWLYCADARSGALEWSFPTRGTLRSSPVAILRSDAIVFGSSDGRLYLLDATSGKPRWQAELGAPISSVPAVVGHSLFVNDDSGRVWRFDAR